MEKDQTEKNTAAPEEELPVEEALRRLDECLDRMGREDIPLEEAFACYEEGIRLLKAANERIDRVEKKVLQLTENGSLQEF